MIALNAHHKPQFHSCIVCGILTETPRRHSLFRHVVCLPDGYSRARRLGLTNEKARYW